VRGKGTAKALMAVSFFSFSLLPSVGGSVSGDMAFPNGVSGVTCCGAMYWDCSLPADASDGWAVSSIISEATNAFSNGQFYSFQTQKEVKKLALVHHPCSRTR
jgi:hypothetical protein